MKPQITVSRLPGMFQFCIALTPKGLGSALTIEDRRDVEGFVEVTLRVGRRMLTTEYWGHR